MKICKQEFSINLTRYINSEGCIELLQNVPLQRHESELIVINTISVCLVIVMALLLVNHIKDLSTNSRVFPFISLVLTPIIIMHVFTVDVKLDMVSTLLMNRLF